MKGTETRLFHSIDFYNSGPAGILFDIQCLFEAAVGRLKSGGLHGQA